MGCVPFEKNHLATCNFAGLKTKVHSSVQFFSRKQMDIQKEDGNRAHLEIFYKILNVIVFFPLSL